MNIEVLQDHIGTFMREVVDSGFKRDLDDYTSSIPASQNNIVALREIAGKVLSVLTQFYEGDLPDSLTFLLPKPNVRPFTETRHDTKLRDLVQNTQIPQQEFFNQLTQFLNQLKQQIQQNLTEITKIREFLAPYVAAGTARKTEQDLATLSISFKETNTISRLGQFTKTLAAWNRALPVYHQLLKSESPEDIAIVEVQNGSIDLVINLNTDVAINLAELFKVGFQCYVAYLSYKGLIKPIVGTYRGNPKLLKGEEEREAELLENIRMAIHAEVVAQHKAAKKIDKGIHTTSIEKKAEEITKLVTSHIVNGNDIRLLSAPTTAEAETAASLPAELRECSTVARSKMRALPAQEMQKLLEKYAGLPDGEDNKDGAQQPPAN